MIFIPQQSLGVRWGLACEVCLCAVTVGKEGFAQIQEGAGLVIAVGVCAVLQGGGNRCSFCIDLHRDNGAQFCGGGSIQGEGIIAVLLVV